MNVRSTAGPCPSESELAAFCEGQLGSDRRGQVAEHALGCPECRDVVASVGYHLDRRVERSDRAVLWRWVAAAASVVLVLAAGWGWWRVRTPEPASIAQLARVTGERRLTEGRLSGGFKWAPVDTVRSGVSTKDQRWDIAAVANEISERAKDEHALGVAHLLLGNLDEAIPHLERASEDAPNDASVWSDLAAALIERGKSPDHAEDLVKGLDAAERAVGMSPDLHIARFNKALAIEKLGLREAAIEAWTDYQKHDPDSPWGKEAASRAARLKAVPLGRKWEEDREGFEAACASNDTATIDELMRRHAQQASEWLMASLGRWGEQELARDPRAAATLDSVERGAKSMAAIVGDPLVEMAVAEIRETSGDRLRRLAEAHDKLVKGRAALDDARAEAANRLLRDSRERFTRLGSPYRDLATLYELSSHYYTGTLHAHLRTLDSFVERKSDKGKSLVAARARWLRGLVFAVSGHPSAAMSQLARAGDELEALSFSSDATFVRSIEAMSRWMLGDSLHAWRIHRKVFSELDRMIDPRRTQALVSYIADETEVQGWSFAAVALHQVAVQFSARHDTPMDRCDALIWLARSCVRAHRVSDAVDATTRARTLLDTVQDPAFRSRLEAELSLVEARIVLDTDPAASIEKVSAACRWFDSVNKENQLVEAYTIRARAYARRGDLDQASDDFTRAVEVAERQRDLLDDSLMRAAFFDLVGWLAREIVEFELRRDSPLRALELADRLRATSFGRARQGTTGPFRIAELVASLPEDRGVLFFSVLSDRTIAWIVRSRGVRAVPIPLDGTTLAQSVRELESSLASPKLLERQRERLFDLLVRPTLPHLDGIHQVVIIPDGCLHYVPWGSLRDSESRTVWFDQVAIAVSPALRFVVGRGVGAEEPPAALLVVANSEPDQERFGGLPPLPGAAAEAQSISEFYPRAIVLTGKAATADRLLDEMSRVDVLHVAAHAVESPVAPEHSALVLSPGGAVAPDGHLSPGLMRGRSLPHLRVAVLATCRSSRGRESSTNGPFSIARSFLENGAQTVVVSLWELPDWSTAPFMTAFHGELRKGSEPAEALRAASRRCWSGTNPDPRVCAGMQLIVQRPIDSTVRDNLTRGRS